MRRRCGVGPKQADLAVVAAQQQPVAVGRGNGALQRRGDSGAGIRSETRLGDKRAMYPVQRVDDVLDVVPNAYATAVRRQGEQHLGRKKAAALFPKAGLAAPVEQDQLVLGDVAGAVRLVFAVRHGYAPAVVGHQHARMERLRKAGGPERLAALGVPGAQLHVAFARSPRRHGQGGASVATQTNLVQSSGVGLLEVPARRAVQTVGGYACGLPGAQQGEGFPAG
jgi:hypothetical protein